MPYISVVMCTYNDAPYLRQAVESILNQSYADFELIIVDDASTDETPSILSDYQSRDKRVRVLRNATNQHISRSANRGIAAAKGAFIARMDSDDIALPHRLSKTLAYLTSNPDVGVVGAQCIELHEKGRYGQALPRVPLDHPAIVWRILMADGCLWNSTVLMRRELFDRVGGYDPDIPPYGYEDRDFWLRLIGITRFANLPDNLLAYRVYAQSTTEQNRRDHTQGELERCSRKIARLTQAPFSPALLSRIQRAFAYHERMSQAQAEEAVQHLMKVYFALLELGIVQPDEQDALREALIIKVKAVARRSPYDRLFFELTPKSIARAFSPKPLWRMGQGALKFLRN